MSAGAGAARARAEGRPARAAAPMRAERRGARGALRAALAPRAHGGGEGRRGVRNVGVRRIWVHGAEAFDEVDAVASAERFRISPKHVRDLGELRATSRDFGVWTGRPCRATTTSVSARHRRQDQASSKAAPRDPIPQRAGPWVPDLPHRSEASDCGLPHATIAAARACGGKRHRRRSSICAHACAYVGREVEGASGNARPGLCCGKRRGVSSNNLYTLEFFIIVPI